MTAVIKNRSMLATSALREDALAIAEAGYAAIDVVQAIKNMVRLEDGILKIGDAQYPLSDRTVYFVGVGKCAVRGARALEKILGDSLTGGIALDVAAGENAQDSRIETLVGTHPLPSEDNTRASQKILDLLSSRKESDLVVMLISGGGSALLSLPRTPMTSGDEAELFKEMTAHGIPISEMNTVRKHISQARGGALAAAAYPAQVVSLIVSDVPGDKLETIASAPTLMDSSTVGDARAVLDRYGIVPSEKTVFSETEKDPERFKRVENVLLLSNQDAFAAMKEEAAQRGYDVQIVDTHFTGESREVGRAIVAELHTRTGKTALLYGGESTVTLGGNSGKGGRNQEMALAALLELAENELLLPFASDGHDNSDHAGAIADHLTLAHAKEKNISPEEHLAAHSSYDFFTTTGDALSTGYTESNVSDLIIGLKS